MENKKPCDVFISYAHRDDLPALNAPQGWVSTFVNEWNKEVNKKLLRMQPLEFWIDHHLRGNQSVPDALKATIRASKVFLLFMSPGYLLSDWCIEELSIFLAANPPSLGRENIFIVDIEHTDRGQWHAEIKYLKGHQFFETLPDGTKRRFGYPYPKLEDPPYWNTLLAVAEAIANHITPRGATTRLSPPIDQSIGSVSKDITVWLAEPADEHRSDHDSVVAALRDAHCNVVPTRLYRRSSELDYVSDVCADLNKADLLVQLLGAPAWSGDRYPEIQANNAISLASATKMFMQWRPTDLNLASIADGPFKSMLQNSRTSSIETFRQDVLAAVNALRQANKAAALPITPHLATAKSITLCVQADHRDRALGEEVCNILDDIGAEHLLVNEPQAGQSPEEHRRDLESMFLDSNGILLIFGQAPKSWLQARLSHARKVLIDKNLLTPCAVIDGPPIENAFSIGGASLRQPWRVLDCRGGIDRNTIETFCQTLRGAQGA
jgi:TIR domain